MMTMTMMQRLLQSEDRAHDNSSPNIEESERKMFYGSASTLLAPYQLANRDSEEIAVNYSHNNNNHHSLFFKSLVKNDAVNAEADTNGATTISLQSEKSGAKSFVRTKSGAADEQARNENGYSEDLVRRLSGESDDSVDVDSRFVEERISSEEDFNAAVKDEDVRSPVDLTSRRLPTLCCADEGCEDNTETAGTTVIPCRHSLGCPPDENSMTVDDAYEKSTDVASTRRLAFSVENILDPNKFTGKQIEDSVKEKFSLPYNWRPHLDFANSSPVDVNRTGKL